MKVPSDQGRPLEERPPDGAVPGRRMLKLNEVLDVEVSSAERGRVRATVAVAARPRHDGLWLAEKIIGGWAETLRASLLLVVVAIVAAAALLVLQPEVGVGGVCATMLIVAMQSAAYRHAVARRRTS